MTHKNTSASGDIPQHSWNPSLSKSRTRRILPGQLHLAYEAYEYTQILEQVWYADQMVEVNHMVMFQLNSLTV